MTSIKNAIIEHFVTQAIVDWVRKTRKDKGAMNFLTGYKTYITAALTIALLIAHWLGFNIPGVDYTALGELGALISVFFARAGAKTDAGKTLIASGSVPGSTTVGEAKSIVAKTGG